MSHFQPNGCLSESGLAAFRDAPPGAAPAEIAVHVTGCERCQNRLLLAGTPQLQRDAKGGRKPAVTPSLGKTLLLAVLALAALLVALITLRRLAGS